MTTDTQFIKHIFAGGWATDFGNSAQVIPQNSIVQLPFLIEADNVVYDFDGGPRKIGGSSKLNSSVISGGSTIWGLYDYWLTGTGGTSTQKRVVVAGNNIYKDDADGTFTSIKSGLEEDKVASFSQFDAARRAKYQANAHLLFQRFQLKANRRGAHP